jgi:hypothetical protein
MLLTANRNSSHCSIPALGSEENKIMLHNIDVLAATMGIALCCPFLFVAG